MGIVQKASFRLTMVSYLGVAIGYLNKVLLFPNLLSTSEVGLVNTLVSVAAIFSQFSAMGMTGVTLRFFPFFRDEKRSHHGFLFWVLMVTSAGALLVSLVFVLFKDQMSASFVKNSPLLVEYYYYLIPLGLSTLFFQIFDSYLRSLLKTVIPSFINEVYLRLMMTACILVYAAGWVNFPDFVKIFVAANCSIAVVVLIYVIWLGQFRIRSYVSFRVKKLSKGILFFGFFSILSSSGNVLLASIDALMVAALIPNGMHFTGIYTTVFFMTTVMLIPYRSVLKISGPLVAQLWKNNDLPGMDKLYKQVTSVNTVLGVFIFIGLWSCLDAVFSFMPKEYALGKYVFLCISIGRLFDMITGLNGIITITSKKYMYDLFFTVFLVGFTIASNYFFIAVLEMQMNGAAIATMITLVLYNILRLLFVARVFGIQPFQWRVAGTLVVGALILVVMNFVPSFENKIIDLFVRAALVTLLFWPLLIYTRMEPEINRAFNKYLSLAGIRYRFPE